MRAATQAVDPAQLYREHGQRLLAHARRLSRTSEDAEDAFQRGLEILLENSECVEREWALGWIHVVIRHEAYAVRRRNRPHAELEGEEASAIAVSDTREGLLELLDMRERARRDLPRLKPQERRALVLLAEGFSYREICALTQWTYTKVNRSISEGKAALRRLESEREVSAALG